MATPRADDVKDLPHEESYPCLSGDGMLQGETNYLRLTLSELRSEVCLIRESLQAKNPEVRNRILLTELRCMFSQELAAATDQIISRMGVCHEAVHAHSISCPPSAAQEEEGSSKQAEDPFSRQSSEETIVSSDDSLNIANPSSTKPPSHGEGSAEISSQIVYSEVVPLAWSRSVSDASETVEARDSLKLLQTCLTRTEATIRTSIAEDEIDPNIDFGQFVLQKKCFTGGTPLAVAVLRGQSGLVSWLLEAGADPNSEYGFRAGALGTPFTGPCAQAAVPSGNLHIIHELLAAKAGINETASNGATLLWQASYFNQVPIVKYLLEHKSSLETRVCSQDAAECSYTALHTATKAGHCTMVATLLDARACVDVVDMGEEPLERAVSLESLDDATDTRRSKVGRRISQIAANLAGRPRFSGYGNGKTNVMSNAQGRSPRSPLQDAIEQGYTSIVKLLVEHGADLFMSNHHSQGASRCLDEAFASENVALIGAIAQGLQKAPSLLSRISINDLIQFMRCGGEVPHYILQAVFEPCDLRFWQADGADKIRRVHRNAAYVRSGPGMNVAVGPHFENLRTMYKDKRVLPESTLSFLDDLTPQARCGGHFPEHFTPIQLLMCHVPEVTQSLDVLLALVHTKCDNIFKEPSCQGILGMAQKRNEFRFRLQFAIAAIEVSNLVVVNFILNGGSREEGLLFATNSVALAVSVFDIFQYALQALGYWSHGILKQFLRNWFNGVALLGTCAVLAAMLTLGYTVKDSKVFSTALGVVVFVRWMQFLFAVCQFKWLGMRILPIVTTIYYIGPFCIVMAICIVSSANLYYALDLHDFVKSFFIIYRLVIMDDMHSDEMENMFGVEKQVGPGGHIEESLAPRSEYYYVLVVMVVGLSFGLGLTLTNLFIAVLNVSYGEATKRSLALFSRHKAALAVEAEAMRTGWFVVKGTRRAAKTIDRAPRRQKTSENECPTANAVKLVPDSSVALADQLPHRVPTDSSSGSSSSAVSLDMTHVPLSFLWISHASE